MKLLLVTVCFIAVLAVNAETDENDVQLEGNQTFTERSVTSLDDQQMESGDMEMLLGRSRWCRRRDGRCRNPKKFSCGKGYQESPMGRPYCTSKRRRCCYPGKTSVISTTTVVTTTTSSAKCPEAEGFFKVPNSTNQCFKFFGESQQSWDASKTKCQKEGLLLAKPESPVPLRKYMIESFGSGRYTWLGAQGAGSVVKWDRDGTVLSSSNSAWWDKHPVGVGRTSSTYCLVIRVDKYEMDKYPTQPYYMWSTCASSNYVLCELVM